MIGKFVDDVGYGIDLIDILEIPADPGEDPDHARSEKKAEKYVLITNFDNKASLTLVYIGLESD